MIRSFRGLIVFAFLLVPNISSAQTPENIFEGSLIVENTGRLSETALGACHGSNMSFAADFEQQLSLGVSDSIQLQFEQPLKASDVTKLIPRGFFDQATFSGWYIRDDRPSLFEYFTVDRKREPHIDFSTEGLRKHVKSLRTQFFRDSMESVKKLPAEIAKSRASSQRWMTDELLKGTVSDEMSIEMVTLLSSQPKLQAWLRSVPLSNISGFDTANVSCVRARESRRFPVVKPSSQEGDWLDSGALSISASDSCPPPANYQGSWFANCYYNLVTTAPVGAMYPTALYFTWAKPPRTGNITYEHDFFIDNNDGKSMWHTGSTTFPNCMPIVRYVVTDLPAQSYPYLDTRFNVTECEKGWVPFTVGVADLTGVAPDNWYLTTIYPYPGNVAGRGFLDRALFQGQRGYRSPSWCYTTWCSFSDMFKTYRGPNAPGGEYRIPSEAAGAFW